MDITGLFISPCAAMKPNVRGASFESCALISLIITGAILPRIDLVKEAPLLRPSLSKIF